MQLNLEYDELIATIEAFKQWSQLRINLAMQMFNEWRRNRELG